MAARYLSGWRGGGQSWTAPTALREASPEESGNALGSEHLWVVKRGKVEEQAGGRLVDGTRIKRVVSWRGRLPAEPNGRVLRVATPRHKSSATAAAALAFAELPGPLGPLLLLYACEDLRLWKRIEPYLLACLPQPQAWEDAMRRIMWGTRATYSPMPKDDRAKQLGIRTSTYRRQTRLAESLLRKWLNRAAWGFLCALLPGLEEDAGPVGNHGDGLNRERNGFPRETRAACALA
jgi:hypothetical protein